MASLSFPILSFYLPQVLSLEETVLLIKLMPICLKSTQVGVVDHMLFGISAFNNLMSPNHTGNAGFPRQQRQNSIVNVLLLYPLLLLVVHFPLRPLAV